MVRSYEQKPVFAAALCALLLSGCLGAADSGVFYPDAGVDAGPDAGVDAGPDAGVDAGPDAGVDAGVDAGPDAGPDAGVDAGPDAGVDAGPDAGVDAGPDAGVDAGPDAGPDAGVDAGPDAGVDAGVDAGPDAGPDGGPDAGPTATTPVWNCPSETVTGNGGPLAIGDGGSIVALCNGWVVATNTAQQQLVAENALTGELGPAYPALPANPATLSFEAQTGSVYAALPTGDVARVQLADAGLWVVNPGGGAIEDVAPVGDGRAFALVDDPLFPGRTQFLALVDTNDGGVQQYSVPSGARMSRLVYDAAHQQVFTLDTKGVYRWSIDLTAETAQVHEHTDGGSAPLALSPADDRLFAGYLDYDPGAAAQLGVVRGALQGDALSTASAISPDGRYYAVADAPPYAAPALRIYATQTHALVATLPQGPGACYDQLAFSLGGASLVAHCSGALPGTPGVSFFAFTPPAIAPPGATGGTTPSINCGSETVAPSGGVTTIVPFSGSGIVPLCDGQVVLTDRKGGRAVLADAIAGTFANTWQLDAPADALTLDADAGVLWTSPLSSTFVEWMALPGGAPSEAAVPGRVTAIAASGNVVFAANANDVLLLAGQDGGVLQTFATLGAGVSQLAYDPGGSDAGVPGGAAATPALVGFGAQQVERFAFDPAAKTLSSLEQTMLSGARTAAFSADGTHAAIDAYPATGFVTSAVVDYDARDLQTIYGGFNRAVTTGVQPQAFSPDGKHFIRYDGALHVLDTATHVEVQTLSLPAPGLSPSHCASGGAWTWVGFSRGGKNLLAYFTCDRTGDEGALWAAPFAPPDAPPLGKPGATALPQLACYISGTSNQETVPSQLMTNVVNSSPALGPSSDLVPLCNGEVLLTDTIRNQLVAYGTGDGSTVAYQLPTAPSAIALDEGGANLVAWLGFGPATKIGLVQLGNSGQPAGTAAAGAYASLSTRGGSSASVAWMAGPSPTTWVLGMLAPLDGVNTAASVQQINGSTLTTFVALGLDNYDFTPYFAENRAAPNSCATPAQCTPEFLVGDDQSLKRWHYLAGADPMNGQLYATISQAHGLPSPLSIAGLAVSHDGKRVSYLYDVPGSKTAIDELQAAANKPSGISPPPSGLDKPLNTYTDPNGLPLEAMAYSYDATAVVTSPFSNKYFAAAENDGAGTGRVIVYNTADATVRWPSPTVQLCSAAGLDASKRGRFTNLAISRGNRMIYALVACTTLAGQPASQLITFVPGTASLPP